MGDGRGKAKRSVFGLRGAAELPAWLAFLGGVLIRTLTLTYRIRIRDPAGFLETRAPWPVIFLLWHNRIVFVPGCFPRRWRENTAVLISASRDGARATSIIRRFGLQIVRGSSSRGGHGALRALKRALARDTSVVLTLDGPRGPRYRAQPGAAALSQLSGVPVVPLSLNAPSRWELGGWDRTQIPKPFSVVELRIGAPTTLSGATVFGDREQACSELEEILLAVTDDARTGATGVRAPGPGA